MKYKLIAISLLTFLSCSPDLKEESRPNIVLVYVDDMGYADIEPFGAKDIATPHLISLASEGLTLTDFNVASSVCSPSRAAILLGAYPDRVGIPKVLAPYGPEWSKDVWRDGIHPDEETLGELLQNEGYVSAMIGKWHLGHFKEHLPINHGFDYFYGIPYSNDMQMHRNDYYPHLPIIEQDKIIEENPDQALFTKRFTEKSIEFIQENKDRPFFVYLAHPMPHVPLAASEQFRGKSKGGLYGDVIEELDWSVGELVKYLKSEDLFENTIFIFTSDNGPWLIFGEHAGSAKPLREGKNTSFEGGHKVPFIMTYPNKIQKNKKLNGLVSNMDILPTILEWVGGTKPKLQIDGVSQVDYLQGNSNASMRDNMLYYHNGKLLGIRKDDWKLLIGHGYQTPGEIKGKEGNRGVETTEYINTSLFDLSLLVSESKNLIEENPKKAEELKNLMDSLNNKLKNEKRAPGRYTGEQPEPRSLW